MAYCGHLSITKNINSWDYKSLIKAECEICDGFLLCKKNNHNNIDPIKKLYIINTMCKPRWFGSFNEIESDNFIKNHCLNINQNIKGYILRKYCTDCIKEKNEIMKSTTVKVNCCMHYNNYNDCVDCEKNSIINNGYCKHTHYGNKNIIYCKICEEKRQMSYKYLSIKNNNKYRCKHKSINFIDGTFGGSFLGSSLNDNEYHDNCEFVVCKHNISYFEECKKCKDELIIGNKCIHNNKSICKQCKILNKVYNRSICVHNIDINLCIDCGIAIICNHNNIYSECIKCQNYCIHDKYKAYCKKCDGSALCKSTFCENNGYAKYNNYCLRCVVYIFQDIPTVKNYKTKEKTVVDIILQKFPDFTWINDKKIDGGCSKRRPDLFLDIGSHIIIVEIDENAHTNYDCSCENKRLMEISQDLRHRPIVFIRFNPDAYIDKNGIKIKSCWKLNKTTGLLILDPKESKQWLERIDSLIDQINYWINNLSEKTIQIIELFY